MLDVRRYLPPFDQTNRPYLQESRLPLLIALIQAMSVRTTSYKLTLSEWQARMTVDEVKLKAAFDEHPELFRCALDEGTMQYSLIYRRFLRSEEPGKRRELTPDEVKMLIDVAIELHSKQFEQQRDERWLLSLLVPTVGALIGSMIGAAVAS